MSVAPFSGSVIILRENADGILAEIYHWANVPEGTPIPPRGPITGILAGGQIAGLGGTHIPATFHAQRMATTRASAKAQFAGYMDNWFPDTTA